MKILLYGLCSPTNIGNAFIDYSSIWTIKKAVPKAHVYFASEFPRWLFGANGKKMDMSFDIASVIDADVVVLSGMVFCPELIQLKGPALRSLSKKGAKIVFNGCGSCDYEQNERNSIKHFLSSLQVNGLISRDQITYNNYKDFFQKAYNGIDCAFFLRDAFDSAPLRIQDYVVFNFDHIREPEIQTNKIVIRTHHTYAHLFPKWRQILSLVTQKPFLKIRNLNRDFAVELSKRNTLISDHFEDYLNLYASASAVYSDRVHACVAALAFGNPARLYANTPRANLFDRVGASEITKRLIKVSNENLNIEKENQLSFLAEILSS